MSDLAEIFRKDPLTYTRDDLTTVITAFRGSRHQFAAGNMKAGSTKPVTEKQKAINKLADSLDLDL